MTRVGFTGTSSGIADAQRRALRIVLIVEGPDVLHHGDCIEGDATAHQIARELGIAVELHPPTNPSKRAFCAMLPGEVVHPKKPYLDRNRDVVDATEVLVATPKEEEGEERRSGTWMTVRYARKRGRPVVIVRPSGKVERESR